VLYAARSALSPKRKNPSPILDREACCFCGGCVAVCPTDALTLEETELRIDADACDGCGLCVSFCPVAALASEESPGCGSGVTPNGESADVVVVGAGPAGSVCAKFLALAGLDVLMVEKRQEIGSPKRCAEGISPQVLRDIGVEPHPRWAANRIRRVFLHAPGGGCARWEIPGDDNAGFVLERKVFDKFLARDAVRAGARTNVKTTARAVVTENGFVRGVLVERMGRRSPIAARLVIAADGVDSKIARTAGQRTASRLSHLTSCAQYEMAGLDDLDEAAIQLFYGNRIAPGGYAWIFPKGGGMANVGIGVKPPRARRPARVYLDDFIAARPHLFSKAQALEINCGGVPVHPATAPLVADGLMVIGDAARTVNPITGGGIKLAMLSGKMAAEVAAAAFRAGDFSARTLRAYPARWDKEHGRKTRQLLKLQRFSDGLTDTDLDRLADILSPAVLEQMSRGRLGPFAALILRKLPHLASLAAKYLRS
jgi:digeranylgeranylglycerophospholipid reductase